MVVKYGRVNVMARPRLANGSDVKRGLLSEHAKECNLSQTKMNVGEKREFVEEFVDDEECKGD